MQTSPPRRRLGAPALPGGLDDPRIDPFELQSWPAAGASIQPREETGEPLAIAEAVLATLELLDTQEPEPPAGRAMRDPGARPARGEDPLNAIVRRCRVRAAGHEGVLSGKRVAIKDSVAIAGIPLTCGSRDAGGLRAALRRRRHGADPPRRGRDRRDHEHGRPRVLRRRRLELLRGDAATRSTATRTAGGSSGGSAAALHYDGVDVGVGCDQGGSIRVPAAWCGVVGLKPTHGLVPYTGIAGIDQTFDHCRPDGAHRLDAAALLEAIAGTHPSDPRQAPTCPSRTTSRAVEQARRRLRGLRDRRRREGFSEEVGAEPAMSRRRAGAVERLEGSARTVRRALAARAPQGGGSRSRASSRA